MKLLIYIKYVAQKKENKTNTNEHKCKLGNYQ